jgi:hypothetical protein
MVATKLFALLLLAQTAQTAQAQEDPFRQLVTAGVEAYRQKKYDVAVEKFEAAYELRAEPELIYNVARSREKQLQRKIAVEKYEQFLTLPGTTAELRQKAMLSLEALRGEQEIMSRNTEKRAPEPPAPLVVTQPQPAPEKLTGSAPRTLEWSLIGGGAGAILVGAVFGGVALTKRNSFESTTDAAAKAELRDDAQRNATIGDIVGGIGLTSAAVGAVLLLLGTDNTF